MGSPGQTAPASGFGGRAVEADMEGFASLVRLLPTAALSLNGRVGPPSRITPLAMTEPSVSYRSSCSCWWTKCIKTSDTGICPAEKQDKLRPCGGDVFEAVQKSTDSKRECVPEQHHPHLFGSCMQTAEAPVNPPQTQQTPSASDFPFRANRNLLLRNI